MVNKKANIGIISMGKDLATNLYDLLLSDKGYLQVSDVFNTEAACPYFTMRMLVEMHSTFTQSLCRLCRVDEELMKSLRRLHSVNAGFHNLFAPVSEGCAIC
jgi:hypothetical protein